ncbi:hypothetical protein AG1IA_06496 [Rhizoctonia solani AG-1 IA]|uniref:Uncharacterized protein n=1 Tax=Thanatephorus cucumeris (strain AG1-IA) TaxID=983506 RepID=L8WRW0_THACA|nr:hypothetical protein AG1IA_06496 [Rhizoctonia solani AG-1 IA]
MSRLASTPVRRVGCGMFPMRSFLWQIQFAPEML